MKFKCILNGCAPNVKARAEELNSFIGTYLGNAALTGSTILFYANQEDRPALHDLVPTKSVELVRVGGYQPEIILDALKCTEDKEDTFLYLFPSGVVGAELAVRWAFRKNGSSLVHVEQMTLEKGGLMAVKKAYADHVRATFRLDRQPFCISLAKGSVERVPITGRENLQIIEHDLSGLNGDGFVRDTQWIPAEQARDLTGAKLLIVGGRGLETRENIRQLKEMAGAMGAEFGISRPVALNAWEPMHRLIGVSGTIARPEICIAAGISGAAAFYAGIEKSKLIIAINTDPQARIVKAADVAIIDDCMAVMDELTKIFMFDCTEQA
ncbi:MAG: FAD-binding protein [Thermodesulfobacteriota bacterium]